MFGPDGAEDFVCQPSEVGLQEVSRTLEIELDAFEVPHKVSLAKHFLDALPFRSRYHISREIPLHVFNSSFPANPVTIGDVIRKLRMEQGLLQKELAQRIEVDEMTIVNWEKSRTIPNKRYIQRIADRFSIHPDDLK